MVESTALMVMRVMGVWVRRADTTLARGAARNAAFAVASDRDRRAESMRTLRDLGVVVPDVAPRIATR